MNKILRFVAAAFTGIFLAPIVWAFVVHLDPKFESPDWLGLVGPAVGGTLGGLVTAALAPSAKMRVAFWVGLLMFALVAAVLLRNGLIERATVLYYWLFPLIIALGFMLGGVISGRVLAMFLHGTRSARDA